MNSAPTTAGPVVWKESFWFWVSVVCAAALLGIVYFQGLRKLVEVWGEREEYSYGYMIPFITAFLIWQKKELLERIPFPGSWAGIVVLLLGVGLLVLGNLSTLYLVVQLSFLVSLAGVVLAVTGWRAFGIIWVPLLILLFMIPLPSFFLQNISQVLQLISSSFGVFIIRLLGISVFLEGNVIDLGTMKLQVVDACSGLRYLFPLMTLGFISAYFFKAPFWKRAVVFLSSIPVTVLMNSFRIGMIGVAVEYWGQSMAEGFLHQFEGWVVFMACTAVLVGEMWILTRIGNAQLPLRVAFGVEFPAPTPENAQVRPRTLPKSYLAVLLFLAVVVAASPLLPKRVEFEPHRKDFAEFPTQLGAWKLQKNERIEQIYLDQLKLSDYLMMDFSDGKGPPINFYVAYYASQAKGQSAHSPRTCIPGGGWKINSLTQENIAGVEVAGKQLRVNRAVIQYGDNKQLVYYWFQQRGRDITNEYLVKWYIFWDALTLNRTDGSLVRLVTLLMPGETLKSADARLSAFTAVAVPRLADYVPN